MLTYIYIKSQVVNTQLGDSNDHKKTLDKGVIPCKNVRTTMRYLHVLLH